MVGQVRELRRKAAVCRRAAGIPTDGAGNADRILMALAEKFEHEAAVLEARRDEPSTRFLGAEPLLTD